MASVCGAMEDTTRDRISRDFADLTALLEDAAGLAVEGQSRRQSVTALKEITARLRSLVNMSEQILTGIERALAEEGDERGA